MVRVKACSQHINSTTLTCNKSTQVHDAVTGHDLSDCVETRIVGARSVLNTCIPMRLFRLKFTNSFSSVQFMCCE